MSCETHTLSMRTSSDCYFLATLATAFFAASSRSFADVMGSPLSFRIRWASWTFVPKKEHWLELVININESISIFYKISRKVVNASNSTLVQFNNRLNEWFRLSWEEGTPNFNDNLDRQCTLVMALASTRGALWG